jgi:hypothetical protein
VAEPKPKENRQQDERNSEFEKFQDLAKRLFVVPKEELDEKRAEREREKRAG